MSNTSYGPRICVVDELVARKDLSQIMRADYNREGKLSIEFGKAYRMIYDFIKHDDPIHNDDIFLEVIPGYDEFETGVIEPAMKIFAANFPHTTFDIYYAYPRSPIMCMRIKGEDVLSLKPYSVPSLAPFGLVHPYHLMNPDITTLENEITGGIYLNMLKYMDEPKKHYDAYNRATYGM